jgi:hypothetical protein
MVTFPPQPASCFCELSLGSRAVMRTLLRSAQTGLYVQSAQDWTGQPEEALDFKTMSRAIRFAEQSGFTKMELAFVSDHRPCPEPVSLEVLRARLSCGKRPDSVERLAA